MLVVPTFDLYRSSSSELIKMKNVEKNLPEILTIFKKQFTKTGKMSLHFTNLNTKSVLYWLSLS